MNKSDLMHHYKEFNNWLLHLKQVADERWHSPIAEGKWSIGAIIAHLLLWDEYSLKERFPLMKEGNELTPFPDYQSVNDQAIELANVISKEELIDKLVEVRTSEFIQRLEMADDVYLNTTFSIGKHRLSIIDYFHDFAEHDLHHKKQIDSILN